MFSCTTRTSRSGLISTCPTGLRCTTTRVPVSVSTVERCCGVWLNRALSAKVRPGHKICHMTLHIFDDWSDRPSGVTLIGQSNDISWYYTPMGDSWVGLESQWRGGPCRVWNECASQVSDESGQPVRGESKADGWDTSNHWDHTAGECWAWPPLILGGHTLFGSELVSY